jgi:hypothetical protein
MTPKAGGQHAPAPQLAGTGRLADDLYLIAHHDRTGRLLLSPRAAGLGLAGALLAELMLAGAIQITAGTVTAGPCPPGDALAAGVLGQVAAEQRHPAQEWLAFLARTAPAKVAGRGHAANRSTEPIHHAHSCDVAAVHSLTGDRKIVMNAESGNGGRKGEKHASNSPVSIPESTVYAYNLDDSKTPGGIKVR